MSFSLVFALKRKKLDKFLQESNKSFLLFPTKLVEGLRLIHFASQPTSLKTMKAVLNAYWEYDRRNIMYFTFFLKQTRIF